MHYYNIHQAFSVLHKHWFMSCTAGARYQALLIPDCPGALKDLAHSGSLARILTHFISQKSKTCCCTIQALLVIVHYLVMSRETGIWWLASYLSVTHHCVCFWSFRACVRCRTGSFCTLLCHRGTEMDIQWIQPDWSKSWDPTNELLGHNEKNFSHCIKSLLVSFFFLKAFCVWAGALPRFCQPSFDCGGLCERQWWILHRWVCRIHFT